MVFQRWNGWKTAGMCALVFLAVLGMGNHAHGYIVHTVRQGDSLERIAAHYLPYTASYTRAELIRDIQALNTLSSPVISPGQTLTIPVIRSEPLKAQRKAKKKDFPARGIYVNQRNAGSREVFDLAGKMRQIGVNTVVFDVKEVHGALAYPSTIPGSYASITSYPSNIEEIVKLVDYLHKMDVHVIARICIFRDKLMAAAMEGWRYNSEWVDPANDDVQQYNLAVIREMIGLGIDEIQLDYFRYPADGRTDTGVEGKDRSDVIAEYLSRIHAVTSAQGVLLSLDIFGIVIWQRTMDISVVGQNVRKIMGYVDIISPMLYPSHFGKDFDGIANPADNPYYFVKEGVQRLKGIVGDNVVIRPWLQSFPLRVTTGYDSDYIMAQIDAAREAGATGWLLWSPGNCYDEAFAALGIIRDAQDLEEQILVEEKHGGSAQESNLPRTLDAPHTGFEVRGTHQDPTASKGGI